MLGLTLALTLLAAPALAEGKPSLDRTAPAVPGAVALYLAADQHYNLGQAAKDPLMVLTAARAILGAGTGDLDRSVTDASGNPICQDNGSADSAACGFTPRDNGDFTVTVTNSGTTPDAYGLLAN